MLLSDYSDDALRKELMRRERERREPPPPVDKPNLSGLQHICISAINYATDHDEYWGKDYEESIIDEAMAAIFGQGPYREWLNKQNW